MNGVDVMVYPVKEVNDDYFLEKFVGDILSIEYDGEMIIVKRGWFQRKGFQKIRFANKGTVR